MRERCKDVTDHPPGSMAMEVTGLLWHNILTTADDMFGHHIVTVPTVEKIDIL